MTAGSGSRELEDVVNLNAGSLYDKLAKPLH
jgi:hypothetical protein